MIHLCVKCDKLLKEGDRVSVTVTSVYHVLKSSIAYALDKAYLEADSATLRHDNCHEGD